jgi:hypothetical protein
MPSAKPSAVIDTRVIYCGDNLDQLKKLPNGCVDLIYIDPPFNSNRNYEVFWGETKEKRSFEDRHESTKAYIDYMRPRCVELHRVLNKTGGFYYHCDWHASHYVKVMLDQILARITSLTKSSGSAAIPKAMSAKVRSISAESTTASSITPRATHTCSIQSSHHYRNRRSTDGIDTSRKAPAGAITRQTSLAPGVPRKVVRFMSGMALLAPGATARRTWSVSRKKGDLSTARLE